ncbi:MAG: ABC transporter ATP-binding protein [Wenzhouxiangella sp.]|nr:ABC transporter ATP-binding protein [Wenzhouxiangella sp.]MCH8477739.1 ABC transporter ATP-binding protein [Wenzhouxiangella sp.]TVR97954.1 MAG: ABC transporter ATP-binding protein [Wenzhouxiangellaceae bacterium]
MKLLEVDQVSLSFGGIRAIDGVSFEVEPGEVFTIVGPNGAGKSSLFNLISRFYQPAAGSIHFDGEDLLARKPHQVIDAGIARTFQNIELFDHATVLDNLLIGRHCRRRSYWFEDLLFLPRVRREERAHRRAVEEVIDFLELAAYRDRMIQGLPYGVRKVVEIAQALVSRPKLLLLDEPAAGLSVEETENMAWWIEDMQKDLGLTIVMVEHDMGLVSRVSDRVLAIAQGRPLAEGTPAEVQAHPEVIRAWLGGVDE